MSSKNTALPALGKIPPQFFDNVIAKRLGSPSERVLVGPQNGVDSGVIDLGNDQVMAVTTDPFFVVPQYGWTRAGWFAVHILASDLSTSGFAPQFMSIDLNLPPEMTEAELSELWQAVHDACSELGITVVTGHTGRYDGCAYPMIGGCTLWALGAKDKYVSAGMSRSDDAVLITKGAAVEAAGLMAVTFPGQIEAAFGADFAEQSQSIFWRMSTVKEALIAASVGVRDAGVTAMHDATECGVFGGLYELARASNIGMEIDVPAIPVAEDVARICDHYQMDPYTSISEGTLLLTCRPRHADTIVEALREQSIVAARIGRCIPKRAAVARRLVAGAGASSGRSVLAGIC
jgi:hydrogenase expression/formation protein HypE